MKNEIIQKAISIAGSQVSLAENSGLSQSAIHKLLTNKSRDMRVSTAIALSKATNIPVMEFLKCQN